MFTTVSVTANSIQQQTVYLRWHRHQSKCQILRSQLGFNQVASSRPSVCQGCCHYHGKAYGQTRTARTLLICGFHPYGWTLDKNCPDWQGN